MTRKKGQSSSSRPRLKGEGRRFWEVQKGRSLHREKKKGPLRLRKRKSCVAELEGGKSQRGKRPIPGLFKGKQNQTILLNILGRGGQKKKGGEGERIFCHRNSREEDHHAQTNQKEDGRGRTQNKIKKRKSYPSSSERGDGGGRIVDEWRNRKRKSHFLRKGRPDERQKKRKRVEKGGLISSLLIDETEGGKGEPPQKNKGLAEKEKKTLIFIAGTPSIFHVLTLH